MIDDMENTFTYLSTRKGEMAMAKRGTFRLKGRSLLEYAKRRGANNLYQVHLRSGVGWQTAHKYMTKASLDSIDLNILADLLIDGVGLHPDEIANLRFGDIFEFVPREEKKAD